jgi:hypothetical protein
MLHSTAINSIASYFELSPLEDQPMFPVRKKSETSSVEENTEPSGNAETTSAEIAMSSSLSLFSIYTA